MTCSTQSRRNASRRDTLIALTALAASLLVGRTGFAAPAPLKIAFIGAGHMGKGLGALLVEAGHEVMFSSRHPEDLRSQLQGLGARAHVGTVAEAVNWGDVVFLTLPYNGMPGLAREHGGKLAAKPLVVDVSNPFPERDGEVGVTATENGAGIYLKTLIPGIKVVRAFNAINWTKLPEFARRQGKDKVAAPILGDDKAAIALAEKLISEMGFVPVLVGGLEKSRYTMPRGQFADAHTPEAVRRMAAELK